MILAAPAQRSPAQPQPWLRVEPPSPVHWQHALFTLVVVLAPLVFLPHEDGRVRLIAATAGAFVMQCSSGRGPWLDRGTIAAAGACMAMLVWSGAHLADHPTLQEAFLVLVAVGSFLVRPLLPGTPTWTTFLFTIAVLGCSIGSGQQPHPGTEAAGILLSTCVAVLMPVVRASAAASQVLAAGERSPRLALRAGVAAVLAILVEELIALPRAYWSLLVAVATTSGSRVQLRMRIIDRALATVLGCVRWAGCCKPRPRNAGPVHFPLLVAVIFAAVLFRPTSFPPVRLLHHPLCHLAVHDPGILDVRDPGGSLLRDRDRPGHQPGGGAGGPIPAPAGSDRAGIAGLSWRASTWTRGLAPTARPCRLPEAGLPWVMPAAGRVRLIDIAARCGVSKAAVSRALSRPLATSELGSATYERIHEAARALGYHSPSRPSGGSHLVAALHGGEVPQLFGVQGHLVAILAYALTLQGRDLVRMSAAQPHWSERLLEREPEGVVVLWPEPSDLAGFAARLTLPMVGADACHDLAMPRVLMDDRANGELMTRHLLQLGHTRIAFVRPDKGHHPCIRLREEGWRAALAGVGLSGPCWEWGSQDASAAVASRLQAASAPTAVVASGDIEALGVMQLAQAHGIRVPGRLSVIGCNASTVHSWPPLTSVYLAPDEVAKRTAALVAALAGGMPASSEPVLVSGQLRGGASTAPP